ncbi:MAG TPA: ABC transporter substrate-binding protein [Ilumatobacter sp.]|nr:ABC transporter substrate-binding protein [Ilumatobacter sp.]
MKRSKSVGLLAVALLTLVSCGDDTSDPAAADPPVTTEAAEPTGSEPTVTTPDSAADPAADRSASADEAGDDVPDDTVPVAIVSLSPTATEMLYAIGAGDQVLAVDDFSNYPAEAADKMQGINGWEPNVEAIAGLEPDLLVTDGTNPDFLVQLDSLGIAHWEGYAAISFDDVYTQIEQLGALTGHVAEAAELVAQMQADVEAVKVGLAQLDEPLTYYHELDSTLYSVTSATFIGAVYSEIGLVNIADEVGDGNPYPQLSAEFILAANPDLIFLACTLYCGETADTVAARPGWDSLDALANGGVIEMDDDVASRWGPRIVDYLELAGAAVSRAAAVRAG